MRATTIHAPYDMRVEGVPDPVVQLPTGAVGRVGVPHGSGTGLDLGVMCSTATSPSAAAWPPSAPTSPTSSTARSTRPPSSTARHRRSW